jgi:hypothetical protein
MMTIGAIVLIVIAVSAFCYLTDFSIYSRYFDKRKLKQILTKDLISELGLTSLSENPPIIVSELCNELFVKFMRHNTFRFLTLFRKNESYYLGYLNAVYHLSADAYTIWSSGFCIVITCNCINGDDTIYIPNQGIDPNACVGIDKISEASRKVLDIAQSFAAAFEYSPVNLLFTPRGIVIGVFTNASETNLRQANKLLDAIRNSE